MLTAQIVIGKWLDMLMTNKQAITTWIVSGSSIYLKQN